MTSDTPLSPAALKRWLLEELCPYWRARIVDPAGGFFEGLDAQGRALKTPARTLLNQARSTFTFSLASLLGGDARIRVAADHGFAFLKHLARPDEPGMAWPRSMDAQGRMLNPSLDAYESSFVMLAMAWYHRATGLAEALHLGEQAYECLQHRLGDTEHGGFFEEHPSLPNCRAAKTRTCTCSRARWPCTAPPRRPSGWSAPRVWSTCSSAPSSTQ